jgi:hypothetical protein
MRHMKGPIDKVKVPEGERGEWRVERFKISKKESEWANLRAVINGRMREKVLPGTYTRLVHKRRGVIMSDTIAEMSDHRFAVMMAKDHVLINGLGIGMVLGAMLKKPEVSRVTVVELEPDVIKLVAPTYTKDRRVEVVEADAFDFQPPADVRYGCVWHDVWDSIMEDNLPEMTKLKRKYGRRTEWQGAWCDGECLALKQGRYR